MDSLDSLNGPSVTVILPFRWRTVVAVAVPLSSSPPVIFPLFVCCSNHSPTRLYAAWISGLLGSQFESSLMNMSMYFTLFLRVRLRRDLCPYDARRPPVSTPSARGAGNGDPGSPRPRDGPGSLFRVVSADQLGVTFCASSLLLRELTPFS